ncbi:MAG TPA: hypothetical protein VGH87_17990 [Polyangiaceae bacterium]
MIALARLPIARLTRTRRAALPLLGWCIAAFGATLLARQQSASSADRSLLGLFVPFVMPLVTYAIASAALGGEGLVGATRPLVRFGASPQLTALAAGVVTTIASAVVCAIVGALLVVAAHNAGDPPIGHDAALTAYAAGLAGAAHGAFFVLGSIVGARGGGRGVALVVNWICGASPSFVSVFVPYAHARSLLGGAPAATLSQRESAWALVAIIVVSLALSSLRVRR